jgi:hypothetical protein
MHFLFGLIFKYEATTEQRHRSQGPNDTVHPPRRGDGMRLPTAAFDTDATTRHVRSNGRFRGQEQTRYTHVEFFAF